MTIVTPMPPTRSDLDTARGRSRGDAEDENPASSSSSSSIERDGRERRRRRREDDDVGRDGRDDARSTRRRRDDAGEDDRGRDRDARDRSRDDDRAGGASAVARVMSRPGDGGTYGGARANGDADADAGPAIPKEEANFGLSGLLAMESNSVNGVALKYVEPIGEAKPPSARWRAYCFKGDVECEPPYKFAGERTKYLFGRDRAVADVPTDHPSCSKQHCVVQFRDLDDGDGSVPYARDLASANGTFVNGRKIPPNEFVRLRSRDVIKFGCSTRDYVLLDEDDAAGS